MTQWNGCPPDPSVDGWHWLRHGGLCPAEWIAADRKWYQGGICCGGSCTPEQLLSPHFAEGVQYLGPCPTPPPRGGAMSDRERGFLAQDAADAAHQLERSLLSLAHSLRRREPPDAFTLALIPGARDRLSALIALAMPADGDAP